METRSAEVKVVGEVRAVELNDDGSGVFRLRLSDGRIVPGRFTPKQEAVLTNTLHHRQRQLLAVNGRGRFNADGILSSIQRIKKCGIVHTGQTPGTKPRRGSRRTRKNRVDHLGEPREVAPTQSVSEVINPLHHSELEREAATKLTGGDAGQHILEVFEELRNSPDGQEVAKVLPTDLAANLGHYLYAPKPGETGDSAAGQDPEAVDGVNLAEMFAEIRQAYPVREDDVEPPADFAANYKHYLYGFPKEDV